MLSSRATLILQNLILSEKIKNLREISLELGFTERIVRYEIEKASEIINKEVKNNVEIIKGNVYIKDAFSLRIFLKRNYDKTSFSPEERENYMLLKILFDGKINQTEVCKEMDISRNTSKLHLKNIKEILGKYHLFLETYHKKGLKLVGEEENIRLCLLRFLGQIKTSQNLYFKELLKNKIYIDEEGIKVFLNYCQKTMKVIISDEAHEIIKNYLKIMVLMIKENHKIEIVQNEKFLEKTQEYEKIKKGITLLEACYDIEISKMELLKIVDYFLGSHTYSRGYHYYENWIEMEIMVKKLIYKFNKRIDVDISQDGILVEGLLNHIKPTIYRIQRGIELENTIHMEVIKSYPNLFKIVEEIVEELEEFIEAKFTADEIAFIVIHFKSAIDRNIVSNENKRKVLVVCGFGYGTSKLLAQQLKESYSLEIVDIVPKHLLEKILRNNIIDIIISTVSIKEKYNIPIIEVNPILSQKDLKKLEEYNFQKKRKKFLFSEILKAVKESSKELDEKLLYKKIGKILNASLIDDVFSKKITIFDVLNKNLILKSRSVKNWEEGVRLAGGLLLKSGYVEEGYIDEMIECIKKYGSYMVLGGKIAFPHARSENNVKKTGFSIVTLKNSVKFPDDIEVKTIIAFSSVDNKEHLDPFMEIVDILNTVNFNIEKIVNKF